MKRYIILAVCIVSLGASGRGQHRNIPNQAYYIKGDRVIYNSDFDYEAYEQKTAEELSKGKGKGSTWPLSLIMIAGVGIIGVAGRR